MMSNYYYFFIKKSFIKKIQKNDIMVFILSPIMRLKYRIKPLYSKSNSTVKVLTSLEADSLTAKATGYGNV